MELENFFADPFYPGSFQNFSQSKINFFTELPGDHSTSVSLFVEPGNNLDLKFSKFFFTKPRIFFWVDDRSKKKFSILAGINNFFRRLK